MKFFGKFLAGVALVATLAGAAACGGTPKDRPTVAEVAEAESALDVDALVREAVDGIERIRIDL